MHGHKDKSAEQQNMRRRTQSGRFLSWRKARREAVLRKMAAMRAAKERKRLERGPVEPEPRMVRSTGLSFGVRDDISGVECWREFKSVREVARVFAVIQRNYRPGKP